MTKRAKQIKQDPKETINNSIGLLDHDMVIKWYFDNKILPQITINNQTIQIPVIYAEPERWKSMQSDGYYRDKNGKMLHPVIVFKRTSIEKDRTLGNKLDGNNAQNFVLFKQNYNKNNKYDAFSVLNNRVPSDKYSISVIPDYVDITYECVVYTDYIEHMNKIIEQLIYASDSYWGDMTKFKFRAKIPNFSPFTEINTDSDRTVKCSFQINIHGYIIPDSINQYLSSEKELYSKAQIIWKTETNEKL